MAIGIKLLSLYAPIVKLHLRQNAIITHNAHRKPTLYNIIYYDVLLYDTQSIHIRRISRYFFGVYTMPPRGDISGFKQECEHLRQAK